MLHHGSTAWHQKKEQWVVRKRNGGSKVLVAEK
jgi:hypothetical protein